MAFSVASIILSVLSTRPQVTSGEFTKEQVKNREVNLLFFGNSHKMPFEQFKWGMKEIIKDKDYVYESLMLDLHLLGKVLHKKYKILRTYQLDSLHLGIFRSYMLGHTPHDRRDQLCGTCQMGVAFYIYQSTLLNNIANSMVVELLQYLINDVKKS